MLSSYLLIASWYFQSYSPVLTYYIYHELCLTLIEPRIERSALNETPQIQISCFSRRSSLTLLRPRGSDFYRNEEYTFFFFSGSHRLTPKILGFNFLSSGKERKRNRCERRRGRGGKGRKRVMGRKGKKKYISPVQFHFRCDCDLRALWTQRHFTRHF